jgi:hypothetical protein
MDRYFRIRDGAFAVLETANWDEFKIRAGEYTGGGGGAFRPAFGRYWFRGQSCSSWPLISSFDRRNRMLAPAEARQKYDLMIAKFQEVAPRYVNVASDIFSERFRNLGNIDKAGLEALAQHHGLPTRLLDWTTSLYVGAFFAFSEVNQCSTDMVSIWILDVERARAVFDSHHLEYIENLYADNVRQLWQMGVFTRNLTPVKSLETLFKQDSEYLPAAAHDGLPMLLRVDIPTSEAPRVLDDLDMMRINSLTLFPGLDGVIRWIDRGGYASP